MRADQACDILMVDDNPDDVELIRLSLLVAQSPHRLHAVKNGHEALEFLRPEPTRGQVLRPDLILLDLNMPVMSGHQVLQEIKSDEHLKAIPVVVLTSSSSPADVRDAYQAHANAYMTKRMDFNELCSEVTDLITRYWLGAVELPPRRVPGDATAD